MVLLNFLFSKYFLSKVSLFPQKISSKTVFNFDDIKKCYLRSKSSYYNL